MEPYHSSSTPKTPLLKFDAASGTFEMSGKSIPENTAGFYKPLIDWLDRYSENPAAATTLNIQLDYFNTSSSKSIMEILKRLERLEKSGKSKVLVNWLYDENDEDIQETGEDYKSLVPVSFQLVPIKK
ncbi:MAG TPA: DUF1987 domain-containing protein [Bacteroidia bacterium]|jgi:hypothetical protein